MTINKNNSWLICLLLSSLLSACSSSSSKRQTRSPYVTGDGYMWSYNDDASKADAASYSADSMFYRKVMPDRRSAKPWEFYYKHCSINGNEVYFSKTSYDCSGPYY